MLQKIYRAEAGQPEAYPNLQALTRPIDWQLIQQQYDQMIKYATALGLGTAETEAMLKRFTRNNLKHIRDSLMSQVPGRKPYAMPRY
jgi:TnpA family transposase